MKTLIKLALSFILSSVFMITCTKSIDLEFSNTPAGNNNPPPPTPPPGKALKLKILEYGTGIPLAGALVSAYQCNEGGKLGCTRASLITTWTSGNDGQISIPITQYPSKLYFVQVTKDGYFDVGDKNGLGNSFYSIADTVISAAIQDSLVIRMFPFAWLRLHIKNILPYGGKESARMNLEVLKNNGQNLIFDGPLNYITPASHFDSTIVYKTRGNAQNNIRLELVDSAFNFLRNIYSETRQIHKNDTTNWDIFY